MHVHSVFIYLVYVIMKEIRKSQLLLTKNNVKLKAQDEEKTIMLKEIHHRVKNNLQIITSLLRLQLYELDENQDNKPFLDSINRISAMAAIHEQMYQGETLKRIILNDYLKSLTDNLLESYDQTQTVFIDIHSTLKTINIEKLVPFSLIINELVTNSIKHRTSNKHKQIRIELTKNNHHILFKYYDNGSWKHSLNESNFGIELIDTFTHQLDGNYILDKENTILYSFEFPLK